MMAENPNWWSLNGSFSTSSTADDHHRHNHGYQLPWTQLLAGRLATDQEEQFNSTSCDIHDPDYRRNQQDQRSSISNDTQINSYNRNYGNRVAFDDHHVKQEMKAQSINQQEMKAQSINQQQQELYGTYNNDTNHKDHDHPWSSCFAGGENNHINYLDFSRDRKRNQHQVLNQYTSHQSNDSASVPSGTSKKARVQPSSTQQPALKVRKEKLGDRITALHQLVSPFGKTDTASVLLEAMGYIRFLEAQVQALSSAYSGNASTGSMRIQQSVNDELASGNDLRSKGLSLVPVDYAHHINNTIAIDNNGINNGADYWASSSI